MAYSGNIQITVNTRPAIKTIKKLQRKLWWFKLRLSFKGIIDFFKF